MLNESKHRLRRTYQYEVLTVFEVICKKDISHSQAFGSCKHCDRQHIDFYHRYNLFQERNFHDKV